MELLRDTWPLFGLAGFGDRTQIEVMRRLGEVAAIASMQETFDRAAG